MLSTDDRRHRLSLDEGLRWRWWLIGHRECGKQLGGKLGGDRCHGSYVHGMPPAYDSPHPGRMTERPTCSMSPNLLGLKEPSGSASLTEPRERVILDADGTYEARQDLPCRYTWRSARTPPPRGHSADGRLSADHRERVPPRFGVSPTIALSLRSSSGMSSGVMLLGQLGPRSQSRPRSSVDRATVS
jgi:hypothetical protein